MAIIARPVWIEWWHRLTVAIAAKRSHRHTHTHTPRNSGANTHRNDPPRTCSLTLSDTWPTAHRQQPRFSEGEQLIAMQFTANNAIGDAVNRKQNFIVHRMNPVTDNCDNFTTTVIITQSLDCGVVVVVVARIFFSFIFFSKKMFWICDFSKINLSLCAVVWGTASLWCFVVSLFFLFFFINFSVLTRRSNEIPMRERIIGNLRCATQTKQRKRFKARRGLAIESIDRQMLMRRLLCAGNDRLNVVNALWDSQVCEQNGFAALLCDPECFE